MDVQKDLNNDFNTSNQNNDSIIENQISNILNDTNYPSFKQKYRSNSPKDTKKIAAILAKYLKPGNILILNGELGAGKTVFMSGIANFFDIEDQVSSPTFSIVNTYTTKENIQIAHFDLYRLKTIDEFLEDIGQDYFQNSICVIEWGNIIKELLPKETIFIDITKDEKDINIRHLKIWRD